MKLVLICKPLGAVLYRARFLVLAIALLSPCALWADIYTWTDEKGNLHFSDQPVSSKSKKIKSSDPSQDSSSKNSLVDMRWHEDMHGFENAKLESYNKSAPILVYFYIESCKLCKPVDTMLHNSTLKYCLERFIKVKVQPEHGVAEHELYHDLVPEMGPGSFAPRLFVYDRPSSKPREIYHEGPALAEECRSKFGFSPTSADQVAANQPAKQASSGGVGGCFFIARPTFTVDVSATDRDGTVLWMGTVKPGSKSPPMKSKVGELTYIESVNGKKGSQTKTGCWGPITVPAWHDYPPTPEDKVTTIR